MSNAARKARKRAGEQFVRTPKEGTPVEEREANRERARRASRRRREASNKRMVERMQQIVNLKVPRLPNHDQ